MALRTDGLTGSAIKRKLKRIEEAMSEGLTATTFDAERKDGDFRSTQFSYDSFFAESLMELHPSIRFELMSFMEPQPFVKKEVGSFIERYLVERGLHRSIDEYRLDKFEINVLAIERTVIEKLVTLIRMSYEEGLHEMLTKTRHFYDLYMTYPLVEDFYNDEENLTSMIELVRKAEDNTRFKRSIL